MVGDKELSILILEDDAGDVVLINRELRKGGLAFRSKRVDTREDFVRELHQNPPDLIFSDHGLPAFDGFSALAIVRDKCPDVPFIFVTGSMGEEMAVETFKSGATDYVLKSRLSNVVPAVQRALNLAEERARRRQTEQALRESEERSRMLVEGGEDYAIIMLDGEGHVTSWNTGADLVHGYAASQIIGRHFSGFYPPEEVKQRRPDEALKIAATEGRYEEEGWRARSGGSPFWANVVITTLRDNRGELRGFAVVTRDITDRKQAQEALQKSEERYRRFHRELELKVRERSTQLEAAKRELEAFSDLVSRDLRNPLLHIRGFVDLLHRRAAPKLDEENREHLQIISESTREMGQLIEELLSFSRLGRRPLLKAPVSFTELVETARRDLAQVISRRSIHWTIGELPEVRGDPEMLRQLWVNLLSNALKYTRPREAARIEIGCTNQQDEFIFFIRDNGVGFDRKFADKLFGLCQRL